MNKLCKSCVGVKPLTQFPRAGGRVCRLCRNAAERLKGKTLSPATGLTLNQLRCRSAKRKRIKMTEHSRLKYTVLAHYSNGQPKCICCSELELLFLGIDHIVPVGRKGRYAKSGSRPFYRWLRKEGFPGGYRVLCHNCNLGRALNGGVCPHEVKHAAVA